MPCQTRKLTRIGRCQIGIKLPEILEKALDQILMGKHPRRLGIVQQSLYSQILLSPDQTIPEILSASYRNGCELPSERLPLG